MDKEEINQHYEDAAIADIKEERDASFTSFVSSIEPMARIVIRRKIPGGDHNVDECFNDFLYRAYRALDNIDPAKGRPLTYCYRILLNTCHSFVKNIHKKKNFKAINQQITHDGQELDLTSLLVSPTAQPLDGMEAIERRSKLVLEIRDFIEDLDGLEQQTALALTNRFLFGNEHDFQHQSIAKGCDLELKQIDNGLLRIRRKLNDPQFTKVYPALADHLGSSLG